MTPVRLEPVALRSRVKHSTTEPPRSHLFPYKYGFYICMDSECLYGPINSYQLLMELFETCLYNVATLNISVKEFIIFVCTDSTEIFFPKLRSAGLNYNLPSFFTDSYCAGGI